MPIRWYEGDHKEDLNRFLQVYTHGKNWNDDSYGANYTDMAQWRAINSKNNIINLIRSDNYLSEDFKDKTTLESLRHASANAGNQAAANSGGTTVALVYLAVAKGIHQPGKDHFTVLHEGYLYHVNVEVHQPRVVVGARPERWRVTVKSLTKGESVQDETLGGWSTVAGHGARVFHT